ncbi:MAG: hypothetical protein JSW51_04575 [Gemmatimonadota bacterium]|nr:MAG: hypothetical protein JSW51_04575 [Gemmatimonadota bacterium]
MIDPRLGGYACLLLCVASCVSGGESIASHTVRDSAGIRIVESTDPAWSAEEQWTIADAAFLDIGVVEGAEAYEFQYISGALRLTNGNIVVANSGSDELRCFDSSGNHMWTAGRNGAGPGEFRNLGWVRRLGADSIVAYDRSLRRISVFDISGAFGRTTNLEAPGGNLRPTALGVLDDGTVIVQANSLVTPSTVAEGLNHVDGWLLRYSAEGERGDTIATAPPASWFAFANGPRRVIAQQPFSPQAFVAITATHVHLGHSSVFEIRSYDAAGNLMRLIRLLRPNRAVTDDDIQTYLQLQLEQATSADERAFQRDLAEAAPYPEEFPSFRSILADNAGRLWVENYRVPGETEVVYSVFAAEGELLGQVGIPPGLLVYEIGEDYVLGRWRDELDVEHIRLHELIKP